MRPLIAILTITCVACVPAFCADFELSAAWPASTPVFQAGKTKAGSHAHTNFREPVVVNINPGRLVVGVHAGNRLAWPERSG